MIRVFLVEGGEGSGNFGHKGRPGKVGGSSVTDSPEYQQKRKEALERLDEWRSKGMTEERIIIDGYKWREFNQRRPDSMWDKAMWDEIKKLADKAGYQYKDINFKTIMDSPELEASFFLEHDDWRYILGRMDSEFTDFRNNNSHRKLAKFLNSEIGDKVSMLSQKDLWESVYANQGRELKGGSFGATSNLKSYYPFPGAQDLLKAKNFQEALETEITVYRGVRFNNPENTNQGSLASYTTSPEIARLFAEGYFHSTNEPGTGKVYARKIKLKDVKAFINVDSEYEVILKNPKKAK